MTKYEITVPDAGTPKKDVRQIAFRRKSVIAAAVVMLSASAARAEQLAIITQSSTATNTGQILLVDSSSIATVTRTFSYALDAGYSLIGADYDKTNSAITAIAASGDICNVFQISLPGTGSVASVTKEALSQGVTNTPCTPSTLPNIGDIEVYSANASVGAGVDRLLPGGPQMYHAYKPSNGAPGGFSVVNVTRADSAIPDLVAVTVNSLSANSQSEVPLGIDGAASQLVQLQFSFDSVTGQISGVVEANPVALPATITINSPSSFDKNANGSSYYLATNGMLYSGGMGFGMPTLVGALPAGTISVITVPASLGATTGGTTGSTTGGTTNSSDSLRGGGSFDLLASLALLIGAGLRGRRARRR